MLQRSFENEKMCAIMFVLKYDKTFDYNLYEKNIMLFNFRKLIWPQMKRVKMLVSLMSMKNSMPQSPTDLTFSSLRPEKLLKSMPLVSLESLWNLSTWRSATQ